MVRPQLVEPAAAAETPGRQEEEEEEEEAPPKLLPGQVCLVQQLTERLKRLWLHEDKGQPVLQQSWANAVYTSTEYLKRRPPNEIEAVLATIDQTALDLVQSSFGQKTLNMHQFAEAIVRTGVYDADRVLGFIGGVVDLFLEVLWSQAGRAEGAAPSTVRWGQLMNHFIESPEIAMFKGTGTTVDAGSKSHGNFDKLPQLHKSAFVDCAKHFGSAIERLTWVPHLDSLVTAEGTESVYFWSPHVAVDAPRMVTPQLPSSSFDESGRALFVVLAVVWDGELQDLVALLSNRMVIVWRLRSREKFQFRQRAEFQIHAARFQELSSSGTSQGRESSWKVFLKAVNPKIQHGQETSPSQQAGGAAPWASSPPPARTLDAEEAAMRREKCEERKAAEISTQLDIWWNAHLKAYITTDRHGKLCLWDLRSIEGAVSSGPFYPKGELTAHKSKVTMHLELSKFKFATASIDRTVVLWDTRNLSPETRIEDHTNAVLSLAYLMPYASLVSVGCEKRVFVWSVDLTAYRGPRAKLSGHQANLLQVSAGLRVFFTLDEASVVILWDGATLACMQTISCGASFPRHCLCVQALGRLCLAGRRFYFFEGSETLAAAMGALPTKEQLKALKNKPPTAGTFKDRALPKFCGVNTARGAVLSVTEAEVRLHARDSPVKSRAIFCMPEGEEISAVNVMDSLHLTIVGTSRGAIHFLKCRSGFAVRSFPGRTDERERTEGDAKPRAPTTAQTRSSGGAGSGEKEACSRNISPTHGPKGSGTAAAAEGAGPKGGGPATPAHGCGGHREPQGLPEGDALPPLEDAEREQEHHLGASRQGLRGEGTHNAPSQDEINKGLSRDIRCIQPCEEMQQVFVGTAEGQVLIFSCDLGFQPIRWVYHPADVSAVTCLHYAFDGHSDGGLLVVGTQDGSAHLYGLQNLRLAGSINIGRVLPESDPVQSSSSLKHVRLIGVSSSHYYPITVLTIDKQSRIRLWGLRLQIQSGKVEELVLLLNAGQLMRSLMPGVDFRDGEGKFQTSPVGKDTKPEKEADTAAAAKKEAAGRGGVGKATGVGSQVNAKQASETKDTGAKKDGAAPSGAAAQEASATVDEDDPDREAEELARREAEDLARIEAHERDILRITCACTIRGMVLLSADAAKQAGQVRSTTKPTDEADLSTSAAFAALAAASGMVPPAPAADLDCGAAPPEDWANADTAKAQVGRASVKFGDVRDPKASVGADNESTTEDDADDVVKIRQERRPTTPKQDAKTTQSAPCADADGGHFMFLGDSFGRIWLFDMFKTVVASAERQPPVDVLVERPSARSKAAKRLGGALGARSSLRFSATPLGAVTGSAAGLGASGHLSKESRNSMILCKDVPADPEGVQMIASWAAHEASIVAIVPVVTPPSLVSTDNRHEVKVWSTTGDLWGHFQLKGSLEMPPTVTVWPPPHILAAQLTLARLAKSLCKRLGLRTRRRQHTMGLPRHLRRYGFAARRPKDFASPLPFCATEPLVSKSADRGTTAAKATEPECVGGTVGGVGSGAAASVSTSASALASTTFEHTEVLGSSGATAADSESNSATGDDGEEPSRRTASDVQESVATDPATVAGPAASDEDRSATSSTTAGDTAAPCAASTQGVATKEEIAAAVIVAAAATNGDELEALAHSSSADESAKDEAGSKTSDRSEECVPMPEVRRKAFSHQQMSEMIRHHAFSSGFQSYQRFAGKSQPGLRPEAWHKEGESLTRLDRQRQSFFGRPASAFGVELRTRKDAEQWDRGVRALGPRSASEGALLRYAQCAVEEMTRSVREDLGVDVSTVTLKQMRKPSFVASLDIGGVSYDPGNPMSATAQAVRKASNPDDKPRMTALANAGNMTLRGGRLRARPRP